MRVRALVAGVVGLALFVPPAPSARAYSIERERELGRRFVLETRSRLPLLDDPDVVGYVRRVGQRLVAVLGPQPFSYKFFVLRAPQLNAFAVPGGPVFVFSGLLAKVGSEDELAGVLAHEIAHVHAHHLVREQEKARVWNYAALIGMLLSALHPAFGAGAMALSAAQQLKYSREFEEEADDLGLRYLSAAGFDPRAMPLFFERLLRERRLSPASVPPYLLTHPLTEARVARSESLIAVRHLPTPAGRPYSGIELAVVQAVARSVGPDPELAVAAYRRRAAARAHDARSQLLLGRAFLTVGRLEAARVALERALELGGVEKWVVGALGRVYLGLGRPADALREFTRRVELEPDDAMAHVGRGQALLELGRIEEGKREFERALAVDEECAEAHRLLAMVSGRAGDETEGLYHLAMAYRLRGELGEALSQFERLMPRLPPGSARRREVDKAIAELKPLVQRDRRGRTERTGRRRPSGAGGRRPGGRPGR